MLAAGVPLSHALAVSYESAQDGPLENNLMRLRESIHKGSTLFEAMEKMPVYSQPSGLYDTDWRVQRELDVMLGTMAEYYDREGNHEW